MAAWLFWIQNQETGPKLARFNTVGHFQPLRGRARARDALCWLALIASGRAGAGAALTGQEWPYAILAGTCL